MTETDEQRISSIFARIADAEARISRIEAKRNNSIERVKSALLTKNIYSAKFAKVHAGYYELSLEERAALLGCTVPQLCKSIIFENTMHDFSVEDSRTNSKFYCVITQYTGKCAI